LPSFEWHAVTSSPSGEHLYTDIFISRPVDL
jgi:hypothetical protein